MEKLQFACQHCGQKLRASARRLGHTVNCPKCSNPTTLLLKEERGVNTAAPAPSGAAEQPPSDAPRDPQANDRRRSKIKSGDDKNAKGSSAKRKKAKAKARQPATPPTTSAGAEESPAQASLTAPQPLADLVDRPSSHAAAEDSSEPSPPPPPPKPAEPPTQETVPTRPTPREEGSSAGDTHRQTDEALTTAPVAQDSLAEADEATERTEPTEPLPTAALEATPAEPPRAQPTSPSPRDRPAQAVDPSYESSAEFDFTSLGGYAYETEETEWVVETDSEGDESSRNFDPHKVAVPRRILYYQGALLAATALFAFVLGMVFGRSFAPQTTAVAIAAPCKISGKVEFTRGGLTSMPDEGSVVIAVPRDYKPDLRERRELEKIGSATDDRDPSVDVLRSIGGDFAITDQRGQFKLSLPDQGRYYLLVLSANSQRPSQEEFNRLHLSEMGTYFGPAQRLVGDRRFHWRTETFDEEQEINILF